MSDVEAEASNVDTDVPKRRTKGKKGLVIAVAAVAATACIAGILFGLKGLIKPQKKSEPQTVLYTQDDEIFMVNLEKSKKEPVVLPGDAKGNAYIVRQKKITPDGQYLCYLSSRNEGDYTYVMYLKKINGKEEAVKIASDVKYFDLLDDGTVIYSNDQALYKANYKGDKEKIGSNIGRWNVTENQKYVIWTGEYDQSNSYYDGLYYSDIALKIGKQKLASAVDGIFEASATGNRIYFLDEDDLYVIKDFKDKEKIASKVAMSQSVEPDGSIYYLKANGDLTLSDLVEDDLKEGDQEISYPQEKDYQHQVVRSSWGGSYTTTETDYDAFYKAVEQYTEVQTRNQIRGFLDDVELSDSVLKKYCKYSNKGESILETNVFYQYDWDQGSKGIGYLTYSEENKISMSDIYDKVTAKGYTSLYGSYITDIIRELLDEEGTYKYCDDNGPISLSENLHYVSCDEAGKTGYGMLIDADNGYQIDLYTFPVTGKDAGICSLYDEDVYLGETITLFDAVKEDDGNIYYLKSLGSNAYELYLNKDMIATDVVGTAYLYSFLKDGVCYYGTDYSNGSFSLWKYEGGKSVKIADDVFDYKVFNSRSIAVLTDYSTKRSKGTLAYYNGKDIDTIADDVQAIS